MAERGLAERLERLLALERSSQIGEKRNAIYRAIEDTLVELFSQPMDPPDREQIEMLRRERPQLTGQQDEKGRWLKTRRAGQMGQGKQRPVISVTAAGLALSCSGKYHRRPETGHGRQPTQGRKGRTK